MPRRHWDHYSVPERMRWFAPNLYRPRRMPPDAVLHSSVREKIDRDVHYRPRQSLSQ
ncbi:MAG: hypothetical protein IT423_04695 [Pirellulaceae bacterium]|nr:hypothetical protein [Pirellulaceae bacterium]